MDRRSFIVGVAALSFMTVSPTSAQETPEPELATEEVAKQATKVVETWIKRVTSKKPEVRLRGWEGLSEGFKGFYFPEGPESMTYSPVEIHGFSDEVTIEPTGHIGVVADVTGLINEHGLYSLKFLLTQDMLIDDLYALPEINVPDGMETTEVVAVLQDSQISVEGNEFDNSDAVILQVQNTGTQFHTVQVFRLNEDTSTEELVNLVAAVLPSMDIATSFGVAPFAAPGSIYQIGFIAEPGTYVVIGTSPGDSLLGVYAEFTIAESQ